MGRKRINLRDQQEVLELMKILYRDEDVTDDSFSGTEGACGAGGVSELVEMPRETKKVFREDR